MTAASLSPFPTSFRVETGHLGEFPYVRAGTGDRTLLVLPGVGDALFPGTFPPGAGFGLAAYFWQYLDTHTVYLLSRPRGLPEGYTAAESADDHARLLEDAPSLPGGASGASVANGAADSGGNGGVDDDANGDADGGVDVLGISMGGLIGQQLAARHPTLVDRLVLADSAYRLDDAARDDVERMRERAERRDWAGVRAQLAEAMFSDARQFAYPAIVLTAGRFVQPRPADPRDPVESLSLILEYEGAPDLERIEQPTLVIGGSEDPYFTSPAMTETAANLPEGRLSLIEGARHGAFHERKATFDRRVTAFLEETA